MPGFEPVACYWLTPTDRHRRGLRRYTGAHQGAYTCEAGWHQALRWLDVIIAPPRDARVVNGDLWPHDDDRWPPACDAGCGYRFADTDIWQRIVRQMWRPADRPGGLTTLDDAAPGAMWDADWLPDLYKGPDGIHLAVRCPNGLDWFVDGPASRPAPGGQTVEGGRWTRTGTPPAVSATPSIAIGYTKNAQGEWVPSPAHYHGFLTAGVLTAG